MKADAFDVQAVVGAVRVALGGRMTAPLHAPPKLTDADKAWLGWAMGEEAVGYTWVRDFEDAIAKRLGRKHAVAVSSGTAALHLALLAVGVKDGSTVALPPLTFAGAAAAARYCGALPWFHSGESAGEPSSIAAAIDVDLLGVPQWFFSRYASRLRAIPFIEDAAQSLGSIASDGPACGSRGNISILSFNNNKIVTTGGGGMVLTDNDAIAERVRFLATTAKVPSPHHYVHTEVGYNYRMPNACAALGLVMLDKMDDTLAKKARLHQQYREAFANVPGVSVVEAPTGVTWNHWLNAIEVPAGQRDATLDALTTAGYECRALYTPLPWLEPYKRFAVGQTFPDAGRRFATTVCLPSGPELAG